MSFDERSHKLATLAVESFGRLGVEGSNFIDQLAASVVGGRETTTFSKTCYRSLQGAGAIACLRARRTDSLRVIPATEFVDIGRCFVGIEEHVAVRCPCRHETDDVDTRHARICPRAGAQVNQRQPLLHAISRTLKRLIK